MALPLRSKGEDMRLVRLGLTWVVAIGILAALPAGVYAANPALTSPAETAYEGALDMSATESLFLEASIIQVTCTESTIEASLTANEEGIASGAIESLSLTNCDSTVDVLASGSMKVKAGGEVYLYANRVTFERFGISCVYGGGPFGTKVGTLEGGKPATLPISAAVPKQSGSSFLCPSTATLEGEYTVTSPEELAVD